MTQPETLPEGVWATLFPRALRLIDEITEHGGVQDPFFTFGGGTVLMLRYMHRFSKDIDIFVPDPQSLGYITPRLSDVAEEMCQSQYVEAANYVKLQFDEGEIDFVASPNLLPDAEAFDSWNMFGREVRVETAAEIVAKKMFHRGDKATARDLFDLAMVVEREPEAIAAAQRFMFRHMASFLANLRAPGPQYIKQFEAIEMISYTPSFRHAAEVALAYLNMLRQNFDQSSDDASSFAASKGLVCLETDVQHGDYSGPVIYSTHHHLVQEVTNGRAVIHAKYRVPAKLFGIPHCSVPVRLRYRRGDAQVSR